MGRFYIKIWILGSLKNWAHISKWHPSFGKGELACLSLHRLILFFSAIHIWMLITCGEHSAVSSPECFWKPKTLMAQNTFASLFFRGQLYIVCIILFTLFHVTSKFLLFDFVTPDIEDLCANEGGKIGKGSMAGQGAQPLFSRGNKEGQNTGRSKKVSLEEAMSWAGGT